MFSALLLWPVRKAALLPAVVLGGAAVGAAYGSFDLSRRAACTVVTLPPAGAERPGTAPFAAFTSLTFTTLVVAAREAMFAPAPVPTPLLPVDSGPWLQRLRNAASLVRHHTRHYPLRFRFFTAFFAGSVGGVSWPLAEAFYNSGGGQRRRGAAAEEGSSSSGSAGEAAAAPEAASAAAGR
jgi:hypothetical protein